MECFMKKIPLIFLAFVIFVFALTTASSAEEETDAEYLISDSGAEITLSVYDNGAPREVSRGDLSAIFSFLDGKEGKLIFDSVAVSAPAELPYGRYICTGEMLLEDGAVITVPQGCDAVFSKMSISVESETRGGLRIKGGSLFLEDSEIKASRGSAVLLDYSSTSSLTVRSAGIYSTSETPTVDIRMGSMTVEGGAIENTHGVAISCRASLTLIGSPRLSGVDTDIETDRGIRVSAGGKRYSGEKASVCYRGEITKGSMVELLYGSDSSLNKLFEIYDGEGRAWELTYFESSTHTDEVSFSAVYNPYTLTVIENGGAESYHYLKGEIPLAPEPAEKIGYTHAAWYREDETGEKYTFDQPITEDVTVRSVYRLSAPRFVISSMRREYDGFTHRLEFSEISHPLKEQGFLSFKWYKDGTYIAASSSVLVKNVSDSGVYSCEITFSVGSDTVTALAETVTVEIEKMLITVPLIAAVEYSGKEQAAALEQSELYSFDGVSGIRAGRYPVPLYLSDTENTAWEGFEGPEATAWFEITKADNYWKDELTVNDVYIGAEPCPNAKPAFGEVRYYYSSNPQSGYDEQVPSSEGAYYVRAEVIGCDDYTGLLSEPAVFEVKRDPASGLEILTQPEITVYTAFDSFIPTGLTVTVHYESGKSEVASAEKITFSYQNGSSFRYGDTAVILTVGEASVACPVEVKKAKYNLSGLVFDDIELVYDGNYHSYDGSFPEVVGEDGISLDIHTSGGGREVGNYFVTVEFSTLSRNYELPLQISIPLSITPFTAEIQWDNTTFVYDGGAKLPRALYIDVRGVQREAKVSGAAVNAGFGYIAKAESVQGNYRFLNSTVSFSIEKADIDLSGCYWSEDSFVFDGTEKRVEFLGLPEGVSVVGYTNGAAASAGDYKASVSLEYDTRNYNTPLLLPHNWKIERAEYDTSGFSFESCEYEYDGRVHYPRLVGNMPVGKDGVALEYSFSCGASQVAEGRVEVEVLFSTESSNYLLPASVQLYVEILPKPIAVTWSVGNYVYSGEQFCPTAVADECGVTVTGGAVNAGSHIAIAVAEDSNYTVLEPTLEFRIMPKENRFTEEPSLKEGFVGAYPELYGKALSGEVRFDFYTDGDCTEKLQPPLAPGVYYAVCESVYNQNYSSVRSEPIKIEVTEVVPTELFVEYIGGSKAAYELICEDDIIVSVTYNSGETEVLPFSAVTVIYESGDSLRRRDEAVKVIYNGLSFELELDVEYAEYDLSGMSWVGTECVYDGGNQCPTLVGLPEGIKISGYEGGGSRAGEYLVSALLEYDSDNYLAPEVGPVTFIIKKQVLEAPEVPVFVYDGTPKLPQYSSLISLKEAPLCVDAGKYTVVFGLTDPENYCFGDGSAEYVRELIIKPRALELSVSDLSVYLFSGIGKAEFSIVGEGLADGEELTVLQTVEGDTVRLTSGNPNYSFDAVGRIVRLPYPSPRFTERIIPVLLLAVLLLLVIILAFRKRERIKDFIAVAVCRIKNRRSRAPIVSAEITAQNSDTAPRGTEATEGKPENADFAENKDAAEGFADSKGKVAEEAEKTDGAVLSDVEDIPEITLSIDMERADSLITDELAKELLKRAKEGVTTPGSERGIINVDTLSDNFRAHDRIDINLLKSKGLMPQNTAYIKVLARGKIDKPLTVMANEFSLSAIKMIALTGGEAIKVVTLKQK